MHLTLQVEGSLCRRKAASTVPHRGFLGHRKKALAQIEKPTLGTSAPCEAELRAFAPVVEQPGVLKGVPGDGVHAPSVHWGQQLVPIAEENELNVARQAPQVFEQS